MKRRSFIALAAGMVAMLYMGKGFLKVKTPKKVKGMKILYVGMDGLDPILMSAFMEKGYLPNFSKLAGQGSFRPLASSNPPQSPVAWTTMATGKNPGRHGIFDFIHRDNDYSLHLSILKEKKDMMAALTGVAYERPYTEKAFWELLAEKGIRSTVIRWPVTFPAEENEEYRLLAGLGVPDINGLIGRYTLFYTDEGMDLQDKSGRYVKLPYQDFIETALEGGRGLSGSPLKIPLSLRIDGNRKRLELQVQNNKWTASEGEWSPWMPIKFKIGFVKSLPAICQFHVKTIGPHLHLYATSIQFDPADPFLPLSGPRSYSKDLVDMVGTRYATLGMPEDTKALMEDALDDTSFLQQCSQTIDAQQKIFLRELASFDNGVLAFVFDTTDRIQHMFWRTLKNTGDIKDDHPIVQIYKYMDDVLGKVLPHAGPDTVLLISSDHGFSDYSWSIHMNTFLHEKGFLKLKGGATAMDRSGLLQAVDWGQTTAYSIGFNSIYLNRKGREKQGIVEDHEIAGIQSEVISALKQLTHEEKGEHPIENVYRKEDIYKGRHLQDAPELIVGPKAGYRFSWQTALGGVPEGEVFGKNDKKWSGDHCIDCNQVPGIVLSNRKIQKENPQITDIAATILKQAGVSAEELDGEPLF